MIKHYFVCANTARGFQNYFSSNLYGLDKVFILKGGPGCGKSTLMKKVGLIYSNMNYDVEYIHCSSDVESLDGIIVRRLGVAIVDGTSPHVIEPVAPGALEEYVHLGAAWNVEELESNVESIIKLQKEIKECYEKVYEALEDGIKIHDEWEKIYINQMDFKKADALAEKLIEWIIGDNKQQKESVVYHRFFGALTPTGTVDYVENLTANMKVRYFIKGRPGTGKSSMLKKISNDAINHGLNVEIYHCALDPNSLDMIILPELKVCVFDSTPPHEYFPSREGDIIVDVYEETITPGTDEQYAEQIHEIKLAYKECINEAKSNLGKAKCLHDDLEHIYVKATDFSIVNQIRKDMLSRIQRILIDKI